MKPLVHGVTLAALFCAAGAQAAPGALIPLAAQNVIQVIDTEDHVGVKLIAVAPFSKACGVAFDPSRDRIYFLAEGVGLRLHVINSDSLAIEKTIQPATSNTACGDIAASPDGGVYFSENQYLRRVDVEAGTSALVGSTTTTSGSVPAIRDIEVSANGDRVYVSLPSVSSVGYFEAGSGSFTSFVTLTGGGIELTGDGRYLYGAPKVIGGQAPSRVDVQGGPTQAGTTSVWNYSGGPALDVAVSADGDRVFVLTDAGEVHAVDPDNDIIGTVTGLGNVRALSLTPDGSHLYAVSETSEKIHIVSVDDLENGDDVIEKTLSRVSNGVQVMYDFIEPASPATAVAVDPTSGGMILATAVEKEGVYTSVDGGDNWNAANANLPTAARERVRVLEFSANGNVLFAATAAGVYKTTDGGQSWKSVNSGLGDLQVTDIQVVTDDGSHLFVSTGGGGVYESDTAGESVNGVDGWSAVNQGLPL